MTVHTYVPNKAYDSYRMSRTVDQSSGKANIEIQYVELLPIDIESSQMRSQYLFTCSAMTIVTTEVVVDVSCLITMKYIDTTYITFTVYACNE